jgi:hypothetical protein
MQTTRSTKLATQFRGLHAMSATAVVTRQPEKSRRSDANATQMRTKSANRKPVAA